MMGKPPMKTLKSKNNILTGINKEGVLAEYTYKVSVVGIHKN